MAPRFALSMCLGLLAAIAAAAGCVVSPQPSPPDIVFDGDRLGVGPSEALVGTVLGFHAAPGTVDPPKGVVVVTNLDATDAPSFAQVQPDGSFAIAVPGQAGQSFRFQVKDGDARSQPTDVVVSTAGMMLSAVTDQPACLALDPARWVALDGAADARSIVIHNQCAGSVSIGAPHLRRGLAGFSFTPTSPIAVGPGGVATLTVHAGAGAEVEDVLFLDVITPAAARRAITLTVPDR